MLPTPLFNNSPRNNCLIQELFLLFSSQTFVCQWKFIYLLQNKDLHSAFASLKLWWPLLRRDRLERFNLKRVSLNRQTLRQTDRWLNYVEIFIKTQCPLLSVFSTRQLHDPVGFRWIIFPRLQTSSKLY